MKKQLSSFLASFAPPVLVLALLSALFWGPVASYLGMTSLELEGDQQVFLSAADTPGDGFAAGDPCGFLMGNGAVRGYGFPPVMSAINFSSSTISDTQKACVTSSGDFYAGAGRRSTAYHGLLGVIDFAWSATNPAVAEVDMETGELTGYAKIAAPAGKNPWIWFDYDTSQCADCSPDDHVFVDMETGELSGYAWSPYLDTTYGYGYISFDGVTMELPPQQVYVYVDVLSLDGEVPSAIDRDNAPMADSLEYYRVRIQFQDVTTGDYLTESDISSLDIVATETADSNVWANQVLETVDAISTGYVHPYVTGCETDTGLGYCVMIEEPADATGVSSTSFNYFVTSISPTSGMIGVNNDEDVEVDFPADRPGCVDPMYPDQGSLVEAGTCIARADKAEYYHSRMTDLNKFELDEISIDVEFSSAAEVSVQETESLVWDGNAYVYDLEGADLQFRPRFLAENFTVDYDGGSYMAVPTDTSLEMELNVQGEVLPVSDFYSEFAGSNPFAQNPELLIYYQTDVDTGSLPFVGSDEYLLLDTDDNGTIDSRYYADTLAIMGGKSYSTNHKLGYGQTQKYTSACEPLASCEPSHNSIADPTIELWICDKISENVAGSLSCYYGGYVDVLDRHVDPKEISIVGAISKSTDATGLFSDNDLTSVIGNLAVIEVRNKMNAVLTRYTSGQSAAGGGTISDLSTPTTGNDLVSLMNGRLIFGQDDVTIEGGLSFVDKTVFVKGGNLFINGNAGSETGGRLGAVVFSSGGVGGNVYIGPDVTELYANFFLDGTLFSYNGDPSSIVDGVPTYDNDEERLDSLKNQLYINGNVTGRYTLGGAADPYAGSWELGNGLTTSDYDTAIEHDLNFLRQYRLCYGFDEFGEIDTSVEEECNEGEAISTYGSTNLNYSPLIIEYSPPTDLPGFVSEGLFQ